MEYVLFFAFSAIILLPIILGTYKSYKYLRAYWRPLICGSSGGPCHDPFNVPGTKGENWPITREGEYNDQE
jgi:hypothetical protein